MCFECYTKVKTDSPVYKVFQNCMSDTCKGQQRIAALLVLVLVLYVALAG